MIDAAVERRVREELANVSGGRYGYIGDLAEYLQVSERTISNYVVEGMPYHMFGQRKRFNFQAVDQWIEQRGAGRGVRGDWK